MNVHTGLLFLIKQQTMEMGLNPLWKKIMTDNRMNPTVWWTPPRLFQSIGLLYPALLFSSLTALVWIISFTLPLLLMWTHRLSLYQNKTLIRGRLIFHAALTILHNGMHQMPGLIIYLFNLLCLSPMTKMLNLHLETGSSFVSVSHHRPMNWSPNCRISKIQFTLLLYSLSG